MLLGDGAGGLSLPVALNFGSLALNAKAGDFDDDGVMDLAVTDNSNNQIAILLGEPSTALAFTSPAADFSTLVKNPDASFTRTLKNGTLQEFDAAGMLTDVIATNGQTTTYAYNAGDRRLIAA